MKILLFFLLSFSSLFAHPIKERLKKANKGDYVVFEEGKHLFLLLVYQTDPTLILEEFSIPTSEKEKISSWQEWISFKSPLPSSHAIYEIDLERSLCMECYSYTKSTFLTAGDNHLLFQLFNLSFEPLPRDKRRKIGPPPMQEDEEDRRSLWNPPLVFEGRTCQYPRYKVFFGKWPNDGSPYSLAEIELYYANHSFPSWLEVRNSHLRLFIKAIDAGKNLDSPTAFFPRRLPRILLEKRSYLTLYVPSYMTPFSLFKDKDCEEKIEYTLTPIGNDNYLISTKYDKAIYLKPDHYSHLTHSLSRAFSHKAKMSYEQNVN